MVDGVTFGYTPDRLPLLRAISFRVAPGEKVALVGRTGSGKTTLVHLLLGVSRPTSGEIRYDNIPLEQLDYRWLRQQIGVVPQETWLFAGSIHDNIVFATPGVSLEDVIAAAKVAMLHDDLVQLPMGYETRLTEGGGGVSGGMRQRIALARALVRRPALLIPDEATNQVDSETEYAIDNELRRMGCTRIVITHRLQAIRTADRILVLQDGCLVEQGTHEELVQIHGEYARLIMLEEWHRAPNRAVWMMSGWSFFSSCRRICCVLEWNTSTRRVLYFHFRRLFVRLYRYRGV